MTDSNIKGISTMKQIVDVIQSILDDCCLDDNTIIKVELDNERQTIIVYFTGAIELESLVKIGKVFHDENFSIYAQKEEVFQLVIFNNTLEE